MEELVSFPSGQVNYLYDSSVEVIKKTFAKKDIVFITDNTIYTLYPGIFAGEKTIVLPPGEHEKNLATIQYILTELITREATRNTMLIGIGGGVITDITGFTASVYMRGIAFGFVPTTLLSMVDAAIGGKNGVNIGLNKNMAGTITQPGFIGYDPQFLASLSGEEWSNGFAEIIKYACIFDEVLFAELQQHDISYYQQNTGALQAVIRKCVDWKNKTVISDEHENGQRKLLNFGHTAGHAIETLCGLSHGKAVAIGMVIAAKLSEEVNSLDPSITQQLIEMLSRYNLPSSYPIDLKKAMELIKMDKKRTDNSINYILLQRIGEASIHPLSFDILEKAIASCAQL